MKTLGKGKIIMLLLVLVPTITVGGFALLSSQQLASNPGPTGPTGPTGGTGPTGSTGPTGPAGTSGHAYYITLYVTMGSNVTA